MLKKRTKVVCTIGPASAHPDTLRAMIKAGMNVARLNFSHGTHDEHAELIRIIREVADELGEPVAILQDLQGPKIRVGELPKEGIMLKTGDIVTFTAGKGNVMKKLLTVTYDHLHKDVKPGERILMDDGLLSAKVLSVKGEEVTTEIIDGGLLTSHKGVNFPDSALTVSAISEKDADDLKFGIAQKVDWVALSFVRSAKEIRDLRAMLPKEAPPIRIIAKIEKGEAVARIDEIIEAVDGIMVARGDLGIEMAAETVPLIQKMLIRKCLAAAKPVVVATQMLDSMIRNPRPTRAEVSDVANAVLDHADAVMLSGESAGGKYPVEAVTMMSNVVRETEASDLDDLDVTHRRGDAATVDIALSEVANILARDIDVKLILVASESEQVARIVSRFRPEMPIAVAAPNGRVQRQLNLSWGIVPFVPPENAKGSLLGRAAEYVKDAGLIAAGEKMIAVDGTRVEVMTV